MSWQPLWEYGIQITHLCLVWPTLSSSMYIPASIMPCIWCHWWPLECVHRGWVSCLWEWEEKTLHRPLGPDLMPGEPHQKNLGWLSSTALWHYGVRDMLLHEMSSKVARRNSVVSRKVLMKRHFILEWQRDGQWIKIERNLGDEGQSQLLWALEDARLCRSRMRNTVYVADYLYQSMRKHRRLWNK